MKLDLQTGFTLVELLITIAVASIIAIATIVNMQEGDKVLAVDISAQRISSALREAQNNALGGKTVGGTHPSGGFGIHTKDGDPVYIFADIGPNPDHIYNSGEEQQTIYLDERVALQVDTIDISFVAPKPYVYVSGAALGYSSTSAVTVTSTDGSYSKIIKVNYAGAIWVQ